MNIGGIINECCTNADCNTGAVQPNICCPTDPNTGFKCRLNANCCDDEDCPAGQTCQNNVCAGPPPENECNVDADCSDRCGEGFIAVCVEEYDDDDQPTGEKSCVCYQNSVGCTNVVPGPCDCTDPQCDTQVDCANSTGFCSDCDVRVDLNFLRRSATTRIKYSCFSEVDFTGMIIETISASTPTQCRTSSTHTSTRCMNKICKESLYIDELVMFACPADKFNSQTNLCSEVYRIAIRVPATYVAGLCTLCSLDWDLFKTNCLYCAQEVKDACQLNSTTPRVCSGSLDDCRCTVNNEDFTAPFIYFRKNADVTMSTSTNCNI